MYCLYNGEYGEHDLSYMAGLDGILEMQKKHFAEKPGMIVGDFTVLEVEYDWGRHDQRWKCQCNLCGRIIYQYHTKDWVRGKGRRPTCLCRSEKIKAEKEAERQAKKEAREKEREEKRKAQEQAKAERAKKKRNYLDPSYIGVRNGHAVTIGKNRKKFILKCDCGVEFEAYPYEVFVKKSVTDCGMEICPYSKSLSEKYEDVKVKGAKFEFGVEEALESKGYTCDHVGKVGDFGVDIIATDSGGRKIAVQCKAHIYPIGVEAVQEVYAGGRYYELENFAVICTAGFTDMAIKMARVLGVFLCDDLDKFEFPGNMSEYTKNLLPVWNKRHEQSRKYYEMNGEKKTLCRWSYDYGVDENVVREQMKRHGLSIDLALKAAKDIKEKTEAKKYTVNGFTGNITQIGDKFGIRPQTIMYRMKHRNMSIEEAIFTPLSRH